MLLLAENGKLLYCNWIGEEGKSKQKKFTGGYKEVVEGLDIEDMENPDSRVLAETGRQLDEYFNGNLKEFRLPLDFRGTPFQKKVWDALTKVGYGQTVSYGEIAKRIGNPKGMRAVAGACGANPISIIVPCHRITSKSGIGGYTGGIEKKKFLMSVESILN